jgi:hypothetical protein
MLLALLSSHSSFEFCFRVSYLAFFKGINQTLCCMVLLIMARKYAGMKIFIPR